ncbi:RIB43A-like with coiled-coils protein 2 [Nymphon striatum]|nr:RIB43A-like with coiled-coils protein 2 [Nymphon striatum]
MVGWLVGWLVTEKILLNDHIAQQQEKKIYETQNELRKNIQDYRINKQKCQLSRDFDLYDPDHLKNDVPCRISDDDPRCTVSSVQKLEGEDLGKAERLLFQKNLMKQWTDEHLKRKKQSEEKQYLDDLQHQKQLLELDRKVLNQHILKSQQEKTMKINVQKKNLIMARQQMEQQCTQKELEIDESLKEIQMQMESDLLTENTDVSKFKFGAHRVIPYQWKGMDNEELEKIRETQMEQICYNKKLVEAERRKKQEFNQNELNVAYQASLINVKFENYKKKSNYERRKFNEKLSEEQKLALKSWELHLKNNIPEEEYFKQFNTSSR